MTSANLADVNAEPLNRCAYSLGVIENRTTLVKQVIDAKLDPRFDRPSEGSIVMVRDIIDDEWIIGSQLR